MNTNTTDTSKAFASQSLAMGSPIEVLEQFCGRQVTGRLFFKTDRISWIVRLESGKVTYASHSVEPFDRLVCHMRYMSQNVPALTKEFRSQVCVMFEDAKDPADSDTGGFAEDDPFRANEYAALCWLVNQQHLNYEQAAKMVEDMTKEAIEPLFWLDEVDYTFTKSIGNPVTLCRLEFENVANHCLQRLRLWQLFAPQTWSPYQRPYFFGQTDQQKKLLPELQLHQKFATILKGFSFRHLAVLLNKDELKVVGSLMPYVCEEVVMLRDPQPPFDLLPKIPTTIPTAFQRLAPQNSPAAVESTTDDTAGMSGALEAPINQTVYKIACVDDSPTVLSEIGRFLDDGSFEVFAINDPLKALVQMLKIKPDLILLDVTMPKVSGYDLCKLLRNSAAFKQTPIIMVTGNTGLIDRAKAKLSGSTDYLTKPFTQDGLLKMIFRYLS
ncbi:response regulator [Pseudanabaena sp. PCC 6802]|uniref:response regulator n=1 Tax=Pseudanabaena sp. PCC 6802 TaxID=118173 RepID=UPI0003463A68|nr:response regulator [Pseudanabaena sp. PCC 6802]